MSDHYQLANTNNENSSSVAEPALRLPKGRRACPEAVEGSPVDTEMTPKIIYIAGYGRSGSTILDILLGNSRAIVGLGEAARFFPVLAGALESRCACGQSLSRCPFWGCVIRTCEQQGLDDWSKITRAQRQVEGIAGLLSLARGDFSPGGSREDIGHLYRQYAQALFTAVALTNSGATLVDSSKTTWSTIGRPLALARLCGFNVRVVHLVRDGRAVMWAGSKGTNTALERGPQRVSFWRGYRTAVSWAIVNALTSTMRSGLTSNCFISLHYEDLTAGPLATLGRLSGFLDAELGDVKEKVERGDNLQIFHHLGGNRLARQGRVRLRADDEWRKKLPLFSRCLYWCTLWPVALLYTQRNGLQSLISNPQSLISNPQSLKNDH